MAESYKTVILKDETVGVYQFDAHFGYWYIKEAKGKHPFKVVKYKTERGAINYIKRQAGKFTSLSQAITDQFGIKAR